MQREGIRNVGKRGLFLSCREGGGREKETGRRWVGVWARVVERGKGEVVGEGFGFMCVVEKMKGWVRREKEMSC